jgi:hypothetical protein
MGDLAHGTIPALKLRFDLHRQLCGFFEAKRELGLIDDPACYGAHESEEMEIEELRGEALGGGNRALAASHGWEGGRGFAGHSGVIDVGNCKSGVTGEVGLAERGERVGGFAGLETTMTAASVMDFSER